MHLEADLSLNASALDQATSLAKPATVNGAPLSETKMKADLAARFSTRSARNSSPSKAETYICHDLPRVKTFRSNN